MKLNLIAALLLCASVATAASETTTSTSTTAPATTEAAAPVKAKAKKAIKKAKKEDKKDSAAVTPATVPSANTQVAPATAAATSTVAAPTVAAPAKKWGVTLLNESSVSYTDAKDMDKATIGTLNYVAGSYKITATEKVGLRQYYAYDYKADNEKEFKTSDINQSFTVATVSTKTKGILGSDDIYPMFWYYMPGKMAEETNFKKDMDNFYGILRADVEIAYTLNPKWSASYYLNPRQTFGAKDDEAKFEASSRLIHYASLYYNVSDSTQIYANAGFDNRMSSERLTSTSDAYLSSVGASMSFLGGKLNVVPEIGVYTALKSGGKAATEQELYKKENVTYTLVTVIAL